MKIKNVIIGCGIVVCVFITMKFLLAEEKNYQDDRAQFVINNRAKDYSLGDVVITKIGNQTGQVVCVDKFFSRVGVRVYQASNIFSVYHFRPFELDIIKK